MNPLFKGQLFKTKSLDKIECLYIAMCLLLSTNYFIITYISNELIFNKSLKMPSKPSFKNLLLKYEVSAQLIGE